MARILNELRADRPKDFARNMALICRTGSGGGVISDSYRRNREPSEDSRDGGKITWTGLHHIIEEKNNHRGI
jgi:hypothetical protein